MIRRPPRSTRTDTLFPYTTLFRSQIDILTPIITAVTASLNGAKLGELSLPETKYVLRDRSEEHTSELQSLMRTSYAVFCLKKKKNIHGISNTITTTKHQHTVTDTIQITHDAAYHTYITWHHN